MMLDTVEKMHIVLTQLYTSLFADSQNICLVRGMWCIRMRAYCVIELVTLEHFWEQPKNLKQPRIKSLHITAYCGSSNKTSLKDLNFFFPNGEIDLKPHTVIQIWDHLFCTWLMSMHIEFHPVIVFWTVVIRKLRWLDRMALCPEQKRWCHSAFVLKKACGKTIPVFPIHFSVCRGKQITLLMRKQCSV